MDKLNSEVVEKVKDNQKLAFSNETELANYLQTMGDVPASDKQSFSGEQLGYLIAEGIAGKNPVLPSSLEKNFISYRGAKAIGHLPVSVKNEAGEFETHVEPVFDLQTLGKSAVAKMNVGTVRDFNRFSHDDKKDIMQNYYSGEGKHKTFKATNDPDKDLQVAKNRAADYLAKRQLGVWGKIRSQILTI